MAPDTELQPPPVPDLIATLDQPTAMSQRPPTSEPETASNLEPFHRSSSRLLQLPAELRVKIWRYALEGCVAYRNTNAAQPKWTFNKNINFFFACKLILHEAGAFLPDLTDVVAYGCCPSKLQWLPWMKKSTRKVCITSRLLSIFEEFSDLQEIVVLADSKFTTVGYPTNEPVPEDWLKERLLRHTKLAPQDHTLEQPALASMQKKVSWAIEFTVPCSTERRVICKMDSERKHLRKLDSTQDVEHEAVTRAINNRAPPEIVPAEPIVYRGGTIFYHAAT